jgi:hypothetical protein
MITLKNLNEASEQEVFDQVAVHLLKQGKVSQNSEGCAYRSSSGLKCAAGCLIADDEYKEWFEQRGWRDLVKDEFVPEAHGMLIQDLQGVHDNAEVYAACTSIKAAFIKGLARIADEYELEMKDYEGMQDEQ